MDVGSKSTITGCSESSAESVMVAEVNQIIKTLEAKLPASLDRKENIKLENQMQKEMASYFDDLEKAFPYSKLEKLYNKYVKAE